MQKKEQVGIAPARPFPGRREGTCWGRCSPWLRFCAVLLLAYGLPTTSERGATPGWPGNGKWSCRKRREEPSPNPRARKVELRLTYRRKNPRCRRPRTSLAMRSKRFPRAGRSPSRMVATTGAGRHGRSACRGGNVHCQPATGGILFGFAIRGGSPLQVYLDAGASYDPDGSIVSYSWSCGERGGRLPDVRGNVIPTRVSVTLTVTDDDGASPSTTCSVRARHGGSAQLRGAAHSAREPSGQ